MPAAERDFRALFEVIQRIVDADPSHTPQVLAMILAGGPFRPFLERPDLMNRVTVLAKEFVSQMQQQAADAPEPKAAPKTAPAPATLSAAHRRRV